MRAGETISGRQEDEMEFLSIGGVRDPGAGHSVWEQVSDAPSGRFPDVAGGNQTSTPNFSLRPSHTDPVRLPCSGSLGEQLGKKFTLIHGNIHFNRRSKSAGFFLLHTHTHKIESVLFVMKNSRDPLRKNKNI